MSSVLILLAVYQGADFLDDQIKSISDQSVKTVHILASDDGSSDGSIKILESAKRSWKKGDFKIVRGPHKGFAENFRSLIVSTQIEADYYAFADQDDIWDSDKLEKAIAWGAGIDPTKPHVYAGRTRIVDITGKPIGLSPLFAKPPSFRNALVQSIAGGNTMVINKVTQDLLAQAARNTGFISHDWWVYQVVTGAGGIFHYEPTPSISYRQHGKNLTGANNSLKARFRRLNRAFGGQMRDWSEHNIAALEKCAYLFTPSARSTLQTFKLARNANSNLERFKALHRSGVYRQTLAGQISLFGACALKLL